MTRCLIAALAAAAALRAQPAEIATLSTPAAPGTFLLAKSGTVAAAVCRDGQLRVWSLPNRQLLRTIDLGKRQLDSTAISADGGWIAAGDHSGQYTVWNVNSGAPGLELRMAYYPFSLAFSPDATRLAIAPGGEPVQVYELASRRKLFQLQRVTGGTQSVVFSADGTRIATADSDTVVRLYDARNGELLGRNSDFLLEPLSASFTPDGRRLVAAGGDKTIALLDAANGKALRVSPKLADPVAYLEVSPDGKFAAAALLHADNMLMPAPVLVSEVESGRQVQEWRPPALIIGGGWTEDGRLLAATATANAVHIWRVR